MIQAIAILTVGFIGLILGAEFFVRGASTLARVLKLSSLFIGLTIVAFGTSTPELLVSTQAVAQGFDDLSMGNVVGSNTFNILFILGISALIAPLVVKDTLLKFDVFYMIGAAILLAILGIDGNISTFDATVFMLTFIAYIIISFRFAKIDHAKDQIGKENEPSEIFDTKKIIITILNVVGGLVALVISAKYTVIAAVDIATLIGISERVIGLTIVAAGTSLPELVTSAVAAYRGERDIAIGNVVGSNIFNILAIFGIATFFDPEHSFVVSQNFLKLDIPFMIIVSIITYPVLYTQKLITRFEGACFMALYVAYTAFLIYK